MLWSGLTFFSADSLESQGSSQCTRKWIGWLRFHDSKQSKLTLLLMRSFISQHVCYTFFVHHVKAEDKATLAESLQAMALWQWMFC